MNTSSQLKAISLEMFRSSLDDLDKSNRWVILGDFLPWPELEKIYNARLNNSRRGAGNKPARMMIGACIIKHMMEISDEDTIEIIRENPYMQYLCGLSEMTYRPICDPSLLVHVRDRLSIDDINAMSLKVLEEQKRLAAEAERKASEQKCESDSSEKTDGKQPEDTSEDSDAAEFVDDKDRRHAGTMKVDATCCDAEVRYPVDVDIIHDGCRKVNQYLVKLCDRLGIRKNTRNYRDARSYYLELVKRKKKQGKFVRLTIGMMLSCLRKDLCRISDIFVQYKGSYELLWQHEKRILSTIFTMRAQQQEMYDNKTHRCADRIVSIFQPHVRPIVRGKAKAKVEFGAKIGASVCEHYTFIDNHSWDAYNEESDLALHIKKYVERFGCLPSTIYADKIYLNKANRKLLDELGIRTYCKPLGRPKKEAVSQETKAKMQNAVGERNEAEATFGTGKRSYGAADIRAKLPSTAECWTGLCYFVKNVMKFLAELCRDLSDFWHFCLFSLFGWPYVSLLHINGDGKQRFIQ